ncbi:16S rRNA (cytosine(1402)-N(4))-methyltransferase RsmH [Segatella buccae]|uniref:Ribosomal RNA small subunit methyltransferase H n=1 Tax=Segatella buccae ATCC 33574 TaxID=873513 RepID=E6K485_9BACT|nr:16S rRNA (cytosine(1402)-N(4))-methyltransferase RsmH [Segatella buccae]EFU31634.1 S-adenosyl-methyltransferase MraW [Segatella buccae ATCC 33574]
MIKTAETYHVPVLLKESVDGLNIRPGGIYVDVTFGGGGHSREILSRLTGGAHLYSFDQDADAEGNVIGDRWWVLGDNEKPKGEKEERPGTSSGPNTYHLSPEEGDEEEQHDISSGPNTYHLSPEEGDEEEQHDISLTPNTQHLSPQPFTFVRSNFRYLKNWMRYYGVDHIDGLLADLGVSSHHFDDETRGFSFRFDAPLDMRMNKRGGRTAADIVNEYDENRLADVFYLYGELKNSRRIAAALVKARAQGRIETTQDFVQAVEPLFRREREKKDMAKLFQALRIEVNNEMTALKEMLLAATELLKPGGRLSVITYHSLEDRIVKNVMKAGNPEGKVAQDFFGRIETPFRPVNNKVIVPEDDEQQRNPRSRSAKLRIAEKK